MGVYDGRSNAELQARLTALLDAYDQLTAGQMVATGTYGQGDGTKSVTFRQTDLVRLQADILLLQQKLGIIHRARRQIRFVYR